MLSPYIRHLCRDGRMILMIRKRGSKYYYIISVNTMEGRKLIERVGGRTKKECQLAEAKARLELGLTGTLPTVMTLNKFSVKWLDEYVSELAENTQKRYKSVLINHILPALGSKKLNGITPMNIQGFMNAKKKDLSRASLNNIHAVLHSLFHYAVSPCGLLTKNPATGIRVPNKREAKKPASVFSREDLTVIFEKFNKEHDFYIPLMIMYHTGCRIGEALALHWRDVDMDTNTIYIHATMLESGEISPIPKSKSSNRFIAFSSKLHSILDERLQEQKELSVMIDTEFPLVCSRNNGYRISTSDMRFFNMWCKEELGHGTLHSFRHTHATMLLELGESLEMVSKRLGHSSISITSRVYSHVLNKRNAKMLASLENL